MIAAALPEFSEENRRSSRTSSVFRLHFPSLDGLDAGLDEAHRPGDRVVQLMGGPGHELADRGQALRPDELLLRPLLLRQRLPQGGRPFLHLPFEIAVQRLQGLVAPRILDRRAAWLAIVVSSSRSSSTKSSPDLFWPRAISPANPSRAGERNDQHRARGQRAGQRLPVRLIQSVRLSAAARLRAASPSPESGSAKRSLRAAPPRPVRFFSAVETKATLLGQDEGHPFHLQGLRDLVDEQFPDLRKTQQRGQPPADLPEKLPVIVPSPEKKAVDEALHPLPEGVEQKDDDERQDQGKDEWNRRRRS